MNKAPKWTKRSKWPQWLVVFALLGLALFVLVDQGICHRWVYHDYAAGIDRKMECFWKK